MKVLTILKSKEDLNIVDTGIIVGLNKFSTNYNVSITLEEIKELSLIRDVFVVINKVIFNEEIEDLRHNLTELSKMNIKGILFYDLSVIQINKMDNLNLNLIWNQTHMVTNYNTCNFYYKNGVKGCLLANELTIDEMCEIKNKTDLEIFANVIFKPIMSHSRRSLLTNYFKSIGKTKEDRKYIINEKISKMNYIVKEDETGTSIIYGNIINGIEPLYKMMDNSFNYIIIDKTYLTDEEYNHGLDLVNKVINKSIDKEEVIELANKYFGSDTGFFYKKTIYKVK